MIVQEHAMRKIIPPPQKELKKHSHDFFSCFSSIYMYVNFKGEKNNVVLIGSDDNISLNEEHVNCYCSNVYDPLQIKFVKQ